MNTQTTDFDDIDDNDGSNAVAVLMRARSRKQRMQSDEPEHDNTTGLNNETSVDYSKLGEEFVAENAVVLTSMSDFLLPTQDSIEEPRTSSKRKMRATTSRESEMDTTNDPITKKSKVETEKTGEDFRAIMADLSKVDDSLERGLGSTIALLEKKGTMKKPNNAGKALDGATNSTKDPSDEIKIEHYDKYGRLLTPKEAFKDLSRKFHGRFSGKAKTDKLLSRIEKEKTQK